MRALEKILVSACLLGERVRYDGGAATSDDPLWTRWMDEGRVVSFCPEMSGGLGTPRRRAERQGLRVITESGADVTASFRRGAELACATAREHRIRIAILKNGSPSCGSTYVYDGTFAGRRMASAGLTTELLRREGVRVFDEKQLGEAAAYLAELESG